MQVHMGKIPGCSFLAITLRKVLTLIGCRLDRSFDKKHGTDTGGIIALKDLIVTSGKTEACNWYEPMPTNVFRQLLDHLPINFGNFELVDFGSGKGRALLIAAEYGFRKSIGVEFAQDLHCIATENIAIYKKRHPQQAYDIEAICMDAMEYPLPNAPLVSFFYSPFTGKVMEQVLNNISASFAGHPREIIMVFYGQKPESIALFKATGFPYRELKLRADWSQLIQYRAFLFTSPKT